MQVREIMSSDPVCVTPDTPVEEAARLMKEKDIGLIPVVESKDSGRLAGVITDRDIAIRHVAAGSKAKRPVREVMTSNITTCTLDEDVNQVMEVMGREQVRRIPIVDERGSIVGVVAQADIVLQTPDGNKAGKTVGDISQPSNKHSQ
jgi:CBS domain-containing protein